MKILIAENFSIKGETMTLGSDLMEGYISPYDSEVVVKLKELGEIIGVSKISPFGLKNDNRELIDRIANKEADLAIAMDSDGSTLSYLKDKGLFGIMPSYGVISRYGLVATNETMDRILIISRDKNSLKMAFEALAAYDEKDSTSYPEALSDYELVGKIDDLDGEYIKYVKSAFEIISAAEFYSSTARFDGILFGKKVDYDSLESLYKNYRNQFDTDVKAKIFKGNYILSRDNRDGYINALKLRRAIRDELSKKLNNIDGLILDEDKYQILNLTGFPAIIDGSKVVMADMYMDKKLLDMEESEQYEI